MTRLNLPGVAEFSPQQLQLVEDVLQKWANGNIDVTNLASGIVLELAVAGTRRKIAFGSATLTWPGATNGSNQSTIAHGLGAVPLGYGAIIEGIGNPDFVYASSAADATNIYLAGWNPAGVQGAGNKTVYWLAVA